MRCLAPAAAITVILAGCGGTASQPTGFVLEDVQKCLKGTEGAVVSEVPLTGANKIEHATGALQVTFALDGPSAGIVMFAPTEDDAKLLPASIADVVRSVATPDDELSFPPSAFHRRSNTVYVWTSEHTDSARKKLEKCLAP